MFNLFKEKLKSWTKKISEKVSVEEKPKKKKQPKGKKVKEIKIPEKFNAGTQKYEPDLEELKENIQAKEVEEKEETKSLFRTIAEKVSKIQRIKINEKDFEIYSEELETLLLENNVAFEVTEQIIRKLKGKIVCKEFIKKEVEEQVKDSLREIIEETLIEPFDIIDNIRKKKADGKPYVMLFCGINGSGKTTTVAKIADFLKDKKISCVIAAGDTFRAASIEQLKKHGDKLGIKVISHDYGSDPASVGFDAIKYAEKNMIDCVLIDTAGRMHTAKDLLREIEKIARVCKPDLKIFVGESITGNDAVEQAKSFNEAIGIDGIILTKSDIDEKGGTALSVGYVTRKPILYLGTGQEMDKIEVFDKRKFVERLGL